MVVGLTNSINDPAAGKEIIKILKHNALSIQKILPVPLIYLYTTIEYCIFYLGTSNTDTNEAIQEGVNSPREDMNALIK